MRFRGPQALNDNWHIRSTLKLPCNDVSDCMVDACSPEIPLFRRRASTFCKAHLKKSTSTVLFARSRFSLSISLRSVDSRELRTVASP